ncbi:MAG: Gfo/Idh/MocA family protein [Phycisphaerales bacterium JB038]
MARLDHIPGTLPLAEPNVHPEAKGVGVLGLHEGRTMLQALATRCRATRPVAGCDRNDAKLAACRAEWPELFYCRDFDAMLSRDDVEIVAIYTPDSQHGEQIVRAFEAGKDVICTKPLVNSLQDAGAVLQAGRRTGRKLLVGQSTRFFEPFQRQRRALERGEYGGLEAIELVDAHYLHRMDWYYRKSPWAVTETDWIFLGLSHPIDLLRWYLGPVREVQAFAARSALGAEFDLVGADIYIVNVRSEDGRLGRALGHYGCHELPSARNCIELMLYGAGGTSLAQYHDMKYIHTGDGDDPMTEVTEDHLYAGRHFYFNSEVHGMHYGEFANYADYFALALREGSAYSPDLEEAVETVCIMEAARRSAESGAPIQLAALRQEVGLA